MVLDREDQGESRKEAIAEVAKATGIAKREVFDVMVAHKGAGRMSP
jgi:16S rRNA (cytidine1402-2'-O)-methyltransferase